MRKPILSMLTVGFLIIMAGVSSRGHAAPLHDDGYVTIGVPDLRQAMAFFRDVLDCEPINPVIADRPVSGPAAVRTHRMARDELSPSRLLICDSGTVVELFDNHGMAPSRVRHSTEHGSEPIQFFTDDVAHADHWLRNEGVRVIGSPVTMSSGPHAGRTLVNFVAPWGLRLQLIGSHTSHVASTP
jgi:catechol 2,3-dioxygenase-like lactoylglutathione lyase family enzyme